MGASVACLLLVVGGVPWGLPRVWDISSSRWCPIGRWALRAVLGVVYLPAQAKDLAALIGALRVTHLQGHRRVVTFVCPQLGVVDVPPGPWSRHAHLEREKRHQGRKKRGNRGPRELPLNSHTFSHLPVFALTVQTPSDPSKPCSEPSLF